MAAGQWPRPLACCHTDDSHGNYQGNGAEELQGTAEGGREKEEELD